MRRRLSAIVAFVTFITALALVPSASSASVCGAMRRDLVAGGGHASGLIVMDADTGKVLCRRAANTPRPLASNMKLFTTSTALVRLGPQSRIPTTVVSSGRTDFTGTLHGSLYLVGGGDPTLGTPAFYDGYLAGLGTNLFALRPQVLATGVRAVTGRLYADDSIFDRRRGVADSGYATSPYIGPLSGLAFNSGFAAGPGGSFASDPALLAASKLARSLRAGGVRISTKVAHAVAPPGGEQIAIVRSPPLTRIVNTTDVWSDNFFAETLIKLLGARFGGAGTTAAGARVVERFARSHDSGVHAVDGSGLTRSNRASPSQVAALLRSMRETSVGEDFIRDLAVAGREGTVADRMHGTRAAGRCRTKTGTISGVSNLSGYCFNRDGRTMVFSVLMASVRDLYLAHYEQDRIAAAVAGY